MTTRKGRLATKINSISSISSSSDLSETSDMLLEKRIKLTKTPGESTGLMDKLNGNGKQLLLTLDVDKTKLFKPDLMINNNDNNDNNKPLSPDSIKVYNKILTNGKSTLRDRLRFQFGKSEFIKELQKARDDELTKIPDLTEENVSVIKTEHDNILNCCDTQLTIDESIGKSMTAIKNNISNHTNAVSFIASVTPQFVTKKKLLDCIEYFELVNKDGYDRQDAIEKLSNIVHNRI